MSNDHSFQARPGFGYVRTLSQNEELPLLRDHLLRLDSESRHDRFNGEGYLGTGEQGVAATRHKRRTGMAAHADQLNPQCAGSGNFFYDANRNFLFLQDRALLDVQFNKRGVGVSSQPDRFQFAFAAALLAPVIEIFPVAVV